MGLFTAAESLAGLDLGPAPSRWWNCAGVRAGFELVRRRVGTAGARGGGRRIHPGPGLGAEAIRRVFTRNRIRTKKVATSVSGRSVIVKKLTLPAASLQELDESIQWEARQVIPFDLSDVQLDYQVLESASAGGDAEVLLVAARKERVRAIWGHRPGGPLSPDPGRGRLCLAERLRGQLSPGLLGHGGPAPYRRRRDQPGGDPGRRSAFHPRPVGRRQPVDRLLQKELRIGFEEAEQVKKDSTVEALEEGPAGALLHSALETLLLEIGKSLDLFEAAAAGESIQQVYVSGDAPAWKG